MAHLDFRRQRNSTSKVPAAIMRRCLIARHSRCSRTGVPPYGLPLIRRIIQVRRRFPGFSKDDWLMSSVPNSVAWWRNPEGCSRGGARAQEGGIRFKVFSVWPMACSQESQMHWNSSLTIGFCMHWDKRSCSTGDGLDHLS